MDNLAKLDDRAGHCLNNNTRGYPIHPAVSTSSYASTRPDSAVAKAGLRTFLAYDFSPTGADAGKYEDPGFGQTPAAYGPSSMHPGIVVCGMGDGSVQALSKQIDAANLFFDITKNNADPYYLP